MMTLAQIRLAQNPILTSLLLGLGQGNMVGETLFPRLPSALRGMTLAKLGDERLRRYNLRRAPGGPTKRINIKYDGQVYSVDQYSVEVPIPRELIQESAAMRSMNVGSNLDISRIGMVTANDVLGLDYELECAGLATDAASYDGAQVTALAGGTKWSSATGTPVTDIRAASEIIRKKIGKRPNTLTLSADAKQALQTNAEVKTYLPSLQLGPATMDQLKIILDVQTIIVGDAIWIDETDTGTDVWGNNAILAYVPKIGGSGGDISLAEPGFGFTMVVDGNPFAEQPYWEPGSKSWIYGVTYERRASIAYNTAGFLFQNPK